jgi:hypothetical protein
MEQMAKTLNKTDDARFYHKRAELVKAAFNKQFVDSAKGIYVDGIGSTHSSLHANMFALVFGLVPDAYRPSVVDFIKSKGMACGVYGSYYLLEALFDAGEAQYALDLLTSHSDRSWYNMIHVGATMTTEAWDNKYKNNNGWSHAWSSSPAHIIPCKLMGIEPLEPGFGKIRIKPQPATLRQAAVQLPTIRGDVRVSFENQPGERFVLQVEIPANSLSEVWLPKPAKKYHLTVNGVAAKGTEDGNFVKLNTGSGEHRLVIEKKILPFGKQNE